jgi:hypothetical protein
MPDSGISAEGGIETQRDFARETRGESSHAQNEARWNLAQQTKRSAERALRFLRAEMDALI